MKYSSEEIQGLVSIIMPVYNGQAYLNETIGALRKSTYKNIEIIIIDDGSVDKSYEICTRFALKDGRVKLFKKENGGIASARNKGLEKARGEFITFCDQDDIVHPNMYEIMVKRINKDDSQIAICSVGTFLQDKINPIYMLEDKVYDGRKEIDQYFLNPILYFTEENPEYVAQHWDIWNCLFRKNNIVENEIFFKYFVSYEDDLLFTIDNLVYCKRISTISNMLYLWRYNFKSESHSKKNISNYIKKQNELEKYIKSIVKLRNYDSCDYQQYIYDKSGLIMMTFIDNEILDKNKTFKQKLKYIKHTVKENDWKRIMALSKRTKTKRESIYYICIKNDWYLLVYLLGVVTLRIAEHNYFRKIKIQKNFNINWSEFLQSEK